jgi:hypothetical protein
MALFPHLEIEDRLLINDKTRLNGAKSFASKGANPVSDITVQAGADGSAVSVFNTSAKEWYLDWEFKTWDADIDASNNKIDFKENGGAELTATIPAATYSLSALAAEVKVQMDATGAETYAVSVTDDDKIEISSSGQFDLLPTEGSNKNESLLYVLNIRSIAGRGDNDYTNLTSFTTKRVRSLPKKVTLNLIDGIGPDEAESKYFELYSEDGANLFSNDQDLAGKRSDILNYVEKGRNSFIKWHFRAQEEIIEEFREDGRIDIYRDPIDLDALLVPDDLKKYSTFKVMRMIFEDLSNAEDDIFERISKDFSAKEMRANRQLFVRADLDQDGTARKGEGMNIRTGRIIRG